MAYMPGISSPILGPIGGQGSVLRSNQFAFFLVLEHVHSPGPISSISFYPNPSFHCIFGILDPKYPFPALFRSWIGVVVEEECGVEASRAPGTVRARRRTRVTCA